MEHRLDIENEFADEIYETVTQCAEHIERLAAEARENYGHGADQIVYKLAVTLFDDVLDDEE